MQSLIYALLVLVLLWSIIVLAIAVHFEGILVSSDLSKLISYSEAIVA